MKASHFGQCMSVKSKLNASSLETKLNNEGAGVVTKALLTPGRCLDNWGVQYNHDSRNKYGSVTEKSARKRETLSLLSETLDLTRMWVGDGRMESHTNVTMEGAQSRCLAGEGAKESEGAGRGGADMNALISGYRK